MTSEPHGRPARGSGKESQPGGSWFATFSLLDAGCAISSSQLQSLVALMRKFWRQTIGRCLRHHSRSCAIIR